MTKASRLPAISFVAVSLMCLPVAVFAQSTGAEAFAQRDYELAETLWQKEAAEGQAEAMLGLGVLADRGYTGERDFEKAFDWYFRAAEQGLAEAQFNIAVMYDAGLGREPDPDRAIAWYTRAALRDYPRAQYNLGLIYEDGTDRVAANAGAARYWYSQASSDVPAAAEKTVPLRPEPSVPTPPDVLFANVSDVTAELAWTPATIAGADYVVEFVPIPDQNGQSNGTSLTETTKASGVLLSPPAWQAAPAWRISNLSDDGQVYEATRWYGVPETAAPLGRITFELSGESQPMEHAATVFANDLRAAGYWVQMMSTPLTCDAVGAGNNVSYAFDKDNGLAQTIQSYLPGIAARKIDDQGTINPGQVIVSLADAAALASNDLDCPKRGNP